MSFEYIKEEAGTVEETVVSEHQPFPLYSAILLACISAVFIAQALFGGSLTLASTKDPAIEAAGFDKQLFLAGQYWRILTGAAMHGGILHAAMNGYALFSFGRVFEMLTNRAHLANVFVLAAVGGGLVSLFFLPDGVSVGASGGIVGLIGYLAVYAFRRRDFISPEFRRGLIFNIGFIFLYGIALYQVVDNFGHLGGLLTGAAYGVIQIPSDPHVDPRIAGSVTRSAGYAMLALFIATSALTIVLIANYR